MIFIKRNPKMSCNITFNPRNKYHVEAAEYLSIIPARRKTAFMVHLIDFYKDNHPYGPDWAEIEKIIKSSNNTYTPKLSIVENLDTKKEAMIPSANQADTDFSSSKPEKKEEDTLDQDISADLIALGIE